MDKYLCVFIVLALLDASLGQQCSFDDECTSYSDTAFCYQEKQCECFAGYGKQEEYCTVLDKEQQTCLPIFSRCPPKTATATNNKDEVVLPCKVKGKIDTCKWKSPNHTEIIPKIGDSYYELVNSMDSSTCNIKIRRPQDIDHGSWTCVPLIEDESVTEEYNSSSTYLTVAHFRWPPSLEYEVHVDPLNITVEEGKSFTIICLVEASRPEAKIRWYIGDQNRGDVLRDVTHSSTISIIPISNLGADFMKTSSFLTLRPEPMLMSDQDLWCNVSHIGLQPGDGYQASTKLNILYKPTFSSSSDRVMFNVNEAASKRVRFSCNPPPEKAEDVKLVIDGRQSIISGKSSHDGNIHLSQIQTLKGGDGKHFEVTITISSITVDVAKQSYRLSVTNHLTTPQQINLQFGVYPSGKQDRHPARMAAGIILVISLLLGLVFLYFAWVRSKWCCKPPTHELLIPESPELSVKAPMLHRA